MNYRRKFKLISIHHLAILLVCILGVFAIIGSGGQRYLSYSQPIVQISSNEYFEAKLRPDCSPYCYSFDLTIQNLTNSDLELDWNKTLFIANGTTAGGFMFDGILYKDRNNPKPPDIIFAKSSFEKTIYPNKYVEYYDGWHNRRMPPGEYGVYLNIKVGDKEIKEKLLVNLVTEKR